MTRSTTRKTVEMDLRPLALRTAEDMRFEAMEGADTLIVDHNVFLRRLPTCPNQDRPSGGDSVEGCAQRVTAKLLVCEIEALKRVDLSFSRARRGAAATLQGTAALQTPQSPFVDAYPPPRLWLMALFAFIAISALSISFIEAF